MLTYAFTATKICSSYDVARVRSQHPACVLPPITQLTACRQLVASLDHLPLLDSIVDETMRMYALVPNTSRKVLLAPLFVDQHGVQHDVIRSSSPTLF
jgi:cytochrome P450